MRGKWRKKDFFLAQIMVTEEVEREKRVLAGEEQRRVISLQVGIGHDDHDHI